MHVARLERELVRSDASRNDRRRSRAELGEWRNRHGVSERHLAALTAPETSRLDDHDRQLTGRLVGLGQQQVEQGAWVAHHPEAARRLDLLRTEIEAIDVRLQRSLGVPEMVVGLDRAAIWTRDVLSRDLGIDLGR